MKYKNIPITFFSYLFLMIFVNSITSSLTYNSFYYTLVYILLLIIVILILGWINKVKIKKLSKKDFLNTLKIFIIYTILILLSTYLIGKFVSIPLNEQVIEENFKDYFILSLFNVCLLTPIIEEITFRYSFRSIDNKYIYILVSSLIFGLCHITNMNEIIYLLPYSLMGIMFCYSFVKTDNILSPILCHILYNIINLVILFI